MEALAALVLNQEVRVEPQAPDRYGSPAGGIYVKGLHVNAELLRKGLAWVDRRHATNRNLYALEAKARAGKLGLWKDYLAIPPWEWRAGRRPAERQTTTIQGLVVGDRIDKLYYPPDCSSATRVLAENRTLFIRRQEAEAQGYRLSGDCH
jgi:hypothetical protein